MKEWKKRKKACERIQIFMNRIFSIKKIKKTKTFQNYQLNLKINSLKP